MHKVMQYLYRKQFHDRISIGKTISLSAILAGFIAQHYSTIVLLVGVLGVLIDLLLNRNMDWGWIP